MLALSLIAHGLQNKRQVYRVPIIIQIDNRLVRQAVTAADVLNRLPMPHHVGLLPLPGFLTALQKSAWEIVQRAITTNLDLPKLPSALFGPCPQLSC